MSQTLLQLVNHRFLNIIYYDHLYVIISIPGQRRVRSASFFFLRIVDGHGPKIGPNQGPSTKCKKFY